MLMPFTSAYCLDLSRSSSISPSYCRMCRPDAVCQLEDTLFTLILFLRTQLIGAENVSFQLVQLKGEIESSSSSQICAPRPLPVALAWRGIDGASVHWMKRRATKVFAIAFFAMAVSRKIPFAVRYQPFQICRSISYSVT
jgi:hypothetical protein